MAPNRKPTPSAHAHTQFSLKHMAACALPLFFSSFDADFSLHSVCESNCLCLSCSSMTTHAKDTDRSRSLLIKRMENRDLPDSEMWRRARSAPIHYGCNALHSECGWMQWFRYRSRFTQMAPVQRLGTGIYEDLGGLRCLNPQGSQGQSCKHW